MQPTSLSYLHATGLQLLATHVMSLRDGQLSFVCPSGQFPAIGDQQPMTRDTLKQDQNKTPVMREKPYEYAFCAVR